MFSLTFTIQAIRCLFFRSFSTHFSSFDDDEVGAIRGGGKKHQPEVDKPVTTKGPPRHVRNGVLFRLRNPVEKLKRVKTNVDEQSRSECARRALLGLASNVGEEKGRKRDVSCMTTDTTVRFIYGGQLLSRPHTHTHTQLTSPLSLITPGGVLHESRSRLFSTARHTFSGA